MASKAVQTSCCCSQHSTRRLLSVWAGALRRLLPSMSRLHPMLHVQAYAGLLQASGHQWLLAALSRGALQEIGASSAEARASKILHGLGFTDVMRKYARPSLVLLTCTPAVILSRTAHSLLHAILLHVGLIHIYM